MMAMVIGTIGMEGTNVFNPSTADITVIEGVIIPSANKVAAPISAMM